MRAREAEVRSSRDMASLVELRSSHDATLMLLAERDAVAEAAQRVHQGLVKELGVVSSRSV